MRTEFDAPWHREPIMAGASIKLALVAIGCGLIVVLGAGSWSASAEPATPAELLESQGITKVKGQYMLADELDAFQIYRETLAAYEAAEQAIRNLSVVAARNQSIKDFQQRIAFDKALANDMRVSMRDGKSPEEEALRRGAQHDRNAAKGERALRGLAKAKPQPKTQKKLATRAEELCRDAEESRAELSRKVREVVELYRSLGTDSEIRTALGDAKFRPSEKFRKLATQLDIATAMPRKGGAGTPPSPGVAPRRQTEALEELRAAGDRLRGIRFREKAKGSDERDKRRDQTVKAIEGAIEKLKRGEIDTKLVDEASRLNGQYGGGRMTARNREGIKDVGDRLKKAAELMRGE